MPGQILHVGASVICMHGGQAVPMTPFPRVTVSGQPIVTLTSPYSIAACGLSGSGTPPCATAQWVIGTARVIAGGAFCVVTSGVAVCIPTGTGLVPVGFQPRVTAT